MTNAMPQGQTRNRSEDKVQGVVRTLQHDIIFGRLKPRERLVEEELGARFDVGRHVVRAAIEELDRLGLVRRRANRGAVVSDYLSEEVDELYDMRTVLQREAAMRIPLPAPAELVAELRAINDVYIRHSEVGELAEAAVANDAFHQALFGACGNRYLQQTIQEYWLKTASIHCYAIGKPDLARQSRDEHIGMIEALEVGDRERLVQLCIDHMLPALEAFKAAHGGWAVRTTSSR